METRIILLLNLQPHNNAWKQTLSPKYSRFTHLTLVTGMVQRRISGPTNLVCMTRSSRQYQTMLNCLTRLVLPWTDQFSEMSPNVLLSPPLDCGSNFASKVFRKPLKKDQNSIRFKVITQKKATLYTPFTSNMMCENELWE